MPRINPQSAAFAETHYDFLIVGAGFAGSVVAERLAAGLGKRVLLIDRRPHIAGNAYDHLDSAGVLVHQYGPHIFHTNAERIVEYLSRFTEWRDYQHPVLASVDGQLLPIPINLDTLNSLYGLQMNEQQAEAFLASRAEPVEMIRTSEDVVINQVGRELYEKFFVATPASNGGWTRRNWTGRSPLECLPVPLRTIATSRIPSRKCRCMAIRTCLNGCSITRLSTWHWGSILPIYAGPCSIGT